MTAKSFVSVSNILKQLGSLLSIFQNLTQCLRQDVKFNFFLNSRMHTLTQFSIDTITVYNQTIDERKCLHSFFTLKTF